VEPAEFPRRHPPFEPLRPEEFRVAVDGLEVACVARGEGVMRRGGPPATHRWIVCKGSVRLEREGQLVQVLEDGDAARRSRELGASSAPVRSEPMGIRTGRQQRSRVLAEHLGGTPFPGFVVAVTVARTAAIVFGRMAAWLGIVFMEKRVAYRVGPASAVACRTNFPTFLPSIGWRSFTTTGAAASVQTGAVLAVLLIVIGPPVGVNVLPHEQAIFPLQESGHRLDDRGVRRGLARVARDTRAAGVGGIRGREAPRPSRPRRGTTKGVAS
jgi:hypothetical protein